MPSATEIRELKAKKRAEIQKRLEHSALAQHIQDQVRHPNPLIGWEGNPYFTVMRHEVTDDIEIWYDEPGREQMVCRAPSEPPPDIAKLLVGLMEWGDEKRTPIEERIVKMDAHNDKIMADRQKVLDDQREEAMDRLELAVVKDIQGSRGRFY